MKTALVVLALLLTVFALVVGGAYLWSTAPDEAPWTARSPEALGELEAGIEDLSRRYFRDAILHFERALELDSEMPAARFFLAQIYSELPNQREDYLEALRDTDPQRMNERERMLREYLLAVADGRRAEGGEVVAAYLANQPDDPWALDLQCSSAWLARDWNEAEACYRRLLKLDPNWVDAQGRLGYIAMARGRFDEAEELFRTYAYIAPDQAAPHAAVGQLVTVLGRYEEAQQAIDRALEIKGDFCEAHHYQVSLLVLQNQLEQAMAALGEMEQIPACSIYEQFGVFCGTRSWLHYLMGDVAAAEAEMDATCLDARGGWDASYHRVSAMTGDTQRAAELLAKARQGLEGKDDDPEARTYFLEAIVLHMEGVQKAADGDWATACELFRAADQDVQYWMISRAGFKLRNRQDLLTCLKQQGRVEEAEALVQEITAINPEYLGSPTVTDLIELAGVEIP
ncbi:MAG: tetratricopeptide repeat protein [Thermoanaerobaculia bacterium]|nr:tetratricopeptide repeat protein [Thermoanaerobaculia bacterium]